MRKFNNHNLFLVGFGRDVNGNPIIKLRFNNLRGFSIQTNNGSFPLTDCVKYSVNNIFDINDLNFNDIETEVVNYIEQFGSKNQKVLLRLTKIN